MAEPKAPYEWARYNGYEVSSRGDRRFSALYAKMSDGRTIEQWYQCDIKGFDPGGTNWKLGKGKPPSTDMPMDIQWDLYLCLWKLWAIQNPDLIIDLANRLGNHRTLSDCFATSHINQAHALATILNKWMIHE